MLAACSPVDGRGPDRAPAASAARPAGGWRIVYDCKVGDNQDLYLAAEGAMVRRLTEDPAQEGLPRFTPDGRSIVFSSDRTGNFQLWQMPAEGGAARRLRTNAATEWQADVSPDGRRLAFLSNQGGAESLWLMDLGSGTERLLVRHGNRTIMGNPHWAPDGRRIVFSSNKRVGHQIYVADTEGRSRRVSPLLGGGCEPRFRPDGRAFVYVSRGHHGDKSRLVEQDLATGEERVLVGWPALNYGPVYSPDGTELAFASNVTGQWVVYRERLSDGHSWRVSFGPGDARDPDYAPR